MKENFFKIASITVIFMLFIFSCSEKLADDLVHRAYELRMDGKADAAQVLLEQAIKKDSADAAAWFELARTKLNIGLGDPHKLIAGLDDMQHTINKAVEIDSNNVIYLFFKGYVCYTRIYATYQGLSKIQVEKVAKETVSTFESVLRLEPNYYEAKLFLVELLKMLPSNVGGDSAKAEKYTRIWKKQMLYSVPKHVSLLCLGMQIISSFGKI